jgi:hypothetical protein
VSACGSGPAAILYRYEGSGWCEFGAQRGECMRASIGKSAAHGAVGRLEPRV